MSDTQLDVRSRVRITFHYTAAGDQLTLPRLEINWPIKLAVLRIWYWTENIFNFYEMSFSFLLLWNSKVLVFYSVGHEQYRFDEFLKDSAYYVAKCEPS